MTKRQGGCRRGEKEGGMKSRDDEEIKKRGRTENKLTKYFHRPYGYSDSYKATEYGVQTTETSATGSATDVQTNSPLRHCGFSIPFKTKMAFQPSNWMIGSGAADGQIESWKR
jgi:hypothetical protein